jgi:catechol 2,3-dioxygenase-like lactoylglutathione lyase family enzyme
MRLFQVNLTVADFPAMLEFYRDRLGFPTIDIDPGPPAEPLVNWASLNAGHAILEIFDVDTYGNRDELRDTNRLAVQICFMVDDVEAEHARLTAAGVELGAILEEDWGKYARFLDPEGNQLQIYEVRFEIYDRGATHP